jgi:hypothetical protein
MQKLKTWWATLKWWQKGLLALPVGLLALVLLLGALWPRARPPALETPATPIPPSTGAQAVETKLDVILADINSQVRAAKEKAKNAKEAIAEADDLAGVDAILYGRKPEGK